MFFRMKRALILMIPFIVVLNVSCSKYIGGEKKQEQVIELSENQFACLKNVPTILKKYANGSASDSEIGSSLDCLKVATTYFIDKTQGSTFDEYTIEDLRKFFGKYFLKQNNLSQEFTFEIMKFKKAILGGSDRNVSKAELRKFVLLIDILKTELVSIRTHFSILSFQSRNTPVNSEVIDESIKKLNRSLKMIFANTSLMNSDYKFEDAVSFIQGLVDYFKESQSEKSMSASLIWLPLLKDIKVILFGQNAYFKNQTDWSLAIDVVTDVWGISLGYKHQLSQFNFSDQNEFDQIYSLALKFLNLLDRSPRMKEEGEILFSDIDILIRRAYQLKIINTSVSIENILHTYQIALIRFFNPAKSKDLRSINSLSKSMLRALRFELKNWGQIQNWIGTLSKGLEYNRSQLASSFKGYSFNYFIKNNSENSLEADALKANRDEFQRILEFDRIPFLGKDLKVFVSFRGVEKNERFNWNQLTYFHLIQVFSRLFMLGYGDNGQLNVYQMKQWYNDFSSLGIELNVFDPRSTGTPERSFQEANLFTFHGNGNEWIDTVEIHELITILIGSGFGAKTELRKFLGSCEIEKLDIFGKKWINEVCFKEQFQKNFDKVFSHLPNLINENKAMTKNQKDWFYYFLISSARTSESKNGLIEDADLRSLMVIINYIEVLISSFDFDHSGNLSLSEIDAASVRFKDFFKVIKPDLSDDTYKKVFRYLVLKGEKPSESLSGAVIDFSGVWISQQFGDYESAGRFEISKLFFLLKKDLMKQ